MPKRRRDQKKKNGQSSKEQSSKEQSSIDCRIVEKANSEKEKGTKNLTDNEKTATCKGMNKKNDFLS